MSLNDKSKEIHILATVILKVKDEDTRQFTTTSKKIHPSCLCDNHNKKGVVRSDSSGERYYINTDLLTSVTDNANKTFRSEGIQFSHQYKLIAKS